MFDQPGKPESASPKTNEPPTKGAVMQDSNQRDSAGPGVAAGPQLASAVRRRALLKGLSKGAALAGAALPLNSLATGDKPSMRMTKSDGKYYHCSISGNMSVMLSAGGNSQPICVGKAVSYYKIDGSGNRPTWPKDSSSKPVCVIGSINRKPTDSFYTCFGTGGSSSQIGLLVDASSPTDEGYWVAAMLNATVMSPSFPYSTTEVLSLYQAGGATQTSAISFFKSYLGGP